MFIIAEIGQAHDGSLGMAHSFIEALSKTGVQAVKFQTHIAEAESSDREPFRIKFSYEDNTRFDYWKRMEFKPEQWKELKEHCEEKGLEFISSPFSMAAVDLLENLGVKRYKIGSGEVSNLLMLKKIGDTGKPVIVSSGMSSFEELDRSLQYIKSFSKDISILQCTTSYPTQPEDWGLNVIQEMKNRYGLPVGYSDHSGNIYACLAATALGAEILEIHTTFDKMMFGPDSSSSLTIAQIRELVEGVRAISSSLKNPVDKSDNKRFSGLKEIFEKSIAVNKNLSKGDILQFDDLESKKPGGEGIPSSLFETVIGKSLRVDVEAGSFLTRKMIDG